MTPGEVPGAVAEVHDGSSLLTPSRLTDEAAIPGRPRGSNSCRGASPGRLHGGRPGHPHGVVDVTHPTPSPTSGDDVDRTRRDAAGPTDSSASTGPSPSAACTGTVTSTIRRVARHDRGPHRRTRHGPRCPGTPGSGVDARQRSRGGRRGRPTPVRARPGRGRGRRAGSRTREYGRSAGRHPRRSPPRTARGGGTSPPRTRPTRPPGGRGAGRGAAEPSTHPTHRRPRGPRGSVRTADVQTRSMPAEPTTTSSSSTAAGGVAPTPRCPRTSPLRSARTSAAANAVKQAKRAGDEDALAAARHRTAWRSTGSASRGPSGGPARGRPDRRRRARLADLDALDA